MAVELGFTSGAGGLISLGITICKGLLDYYSSFRDAEVNVRQLYDSIEALTKTLVLITRSLQSRHLSRDVAATIEQNVTSCADGIKRLEKKLKKIKVTPKGEGWKAKAGALGHKILYPFKESTLMKMREISTELRDNLGLTMSVLSIDAATATLCKLDNLDLQAKGVSIRMDDLRGQMSKTTTDEYFLKIHNWLSPLAGYFETKQLDTFNFKGRQDGGSHHLIRTDEFRRWMSETGKTLWYTGMQEGTGKTVMVSIIVNFLQQTTSKGDNGLAYIYCNYKEAAKQTPTNLIASLLQQLVAQTSSNNIYDLIDTYAKHTKQKTRPSLHEYSQLLRTTVDTFSRVFIIIDALDECPESDDARHILLNKIKELKPKVCLLVTSRPIPSIGRILKDAVHVEVQANAEDITNYLEERISGSETMQAHLEKDPTLRQTIISRIVQKVKGMFLMARLYLDSLATKLTRRKVKSALDSLPDGLNQMYDEVIKRIKAQNSDHAALAIRTLRWIYFAVRPLTVQEIITALAVEPGDVYLDEDGLLDRDLLISVCAGMVVVNKESDTIGLVHYTAQEYFGSGGERALKRGHMDIAQTCLTYLLFNEFGTDPRIDRRDVKIRLQESPFLGYAMQHWGVHVRYCSDEAVKELTVEFLEHEARISLFAQVMQLSEHEDGVSSHEFTHGVQALSIAASFGLYDIAVELLKKDPDIDLKDLNGRTALHLAVNQDHETVAQLLLDGGADVNAKDSYGWTALHRAASRGLTQTARLLLNRNADVKALDGYNGTALYRAAESGHVAVAELLLQEGSDIEARNSYNQTALHRAAENGHEAVVRLLLQRKANAQAKDTYGWTALYRAADNGHEDVAEILQIYTESLS
ncbi:MAG: hypothetical protein M1816_004032 [Peltula sp. TS41687]|nr:MAG: hypothetical protein M1816_004032 [Peltula sp. TS41687]